MKIDAIEVGRFAREVYSNEPPDKDDIDGRSLLIFGENRSGKTLTFNAILYCLLGAQETIDLSTGRRNRVSLSFDSGSTFIRGQPQALFDDGDRTLESQDAQEQMEEMLQDSDLIKYHFLHSRIGFLPLEGLSKSERLSLIRKVTHNELEVQIRYHNRAAEYLEDLSVRARDSRRRRAEELPDLRDQLSNVEWQLEQHQQARQLIESGEMEEIAEQLRRNQALNEELDELFKEREGLRQKINKVNRKKRQHENYNREVIELIAEAVNDFVCPACDHRISTEKAKNRLNNSICPYCGEQRSLTELKENLEERVEGSGELVAELEEELRDLRQQRSDIETEIEALTEELPELSELDAGTKRLLEEHDYDTANLGPEVEEHIESAQAAQHELAAEIEHIESQIEAEEQRADAYEESLDGAYAAVEELEEQSFQEDIQRFASTWSEYNQEMSESIGLEVRVTDEGEVIVPGEEGLRYYDRGGDLSDSEIRLLNYSFVYTLNEFALESGLIDWETFVLDEPFASLDTDSTNELLDFFENSVKQFIITSSDDTVRDRFESDDVLSLHRSPIQAEIGDFI